MTEVLGGEDAVIVVDARAPVLVSTVAAIETAGGTVDWSLELADTGLLFFDCAAWLTAASTLPPHEKIDSVAWARMSAARGEISLLLVLLTPSVLWAEVVAVVDEQVEACEAVSSSDRGASARALLAGISEEGFDADTFLPPPLLRVHEGLA